MDRSRLARRVQDALDDGDLVGVQRLVVMFARSTAVSMTAALDQLVQDGVLETGTMVAIHGLGEQLPEEGQPPSDGDSSDAECSFEEDEEEMDAEREQEYLAQFVLPEAPASLDISQGRQQSQAEFEYSVQVLIDTLRQRQAGDNRDSSGDAHPANPPSQEPLAHARPTRGR